MIQLLYSSKPSLRSIVILNNVKPAVGNEKTNIEVIRERGTNVITVSGRFRKDADSLITYATVQNPTQFAMLFLKTV